MTRHCRLSPVLVPINVGFVLDRFIPTRACLSFRLVAAPAKFEHDFAAVRPIKLNRSSGDSVLKQLFILMLMTMQLLSGGGGSVYLCISNDGLCSIEMGPDSCMSCEVSCATGCNTNRADSPVQNGRMPCSIPECDGLFHEISESLTTTGSCGCTHIPITMSSDQPKRNARTSIAVDFERFTLRVAHVLKSGLVCLPAIPSSEHRRNTLAIPNLTLTVVSAVNIRC